MELQIRKMRPSDFQPLHRLLSDPVVMQFLEPPFSEERTRNFMSEVGFCDSPLVYSVELKNQFIGYVIYHAYEEDTVEIGWVLLPAFWGKGYASRLTQILIERARREGKRVVIECVPQQTVSRHIAEKNGFDYSGRVEGLDVFRLDR